MSCSKKSIDVPMAAAGGLRPPPVAAPVDPFQVLDDLMAVIEELCPVWPPRATFRNEAHNKL